MPYIGRDLNRGNYLKLDDISSSFNGSTQTFSLTVGGSAFLPGSAFSILVSVGGVIQEPESAYQINNSEITFANAPTASDGFFCIALGMPIGIGVPGNGTVNGTQIAKPFNYDGFFYLNDASNRVGINSSIPSEALDIIGNTKISGIVTATEFSGQLSNTSGISTFYDLRVTNNLTVEGTTTTLDTNLTGVDRVEINANSNSNAAIVGIQSGSAEIVKLLDGTDEVLKVNDGGIIDIESYIRHIDATGTSIGFPETGSQIIANTNGSRKFTLDGDGRVLLGISTATFIAQGGSDLLIEKTVGAGGTVSIDLYSKNVTGSAFLRFYNGSQSGKIGLVGAGTSIIFCAHGVNAERMRLTGVGLGIKNNNPQTALHIKQAIDNNSDGFRISRVNSAASYSQYIDTSARFNIGYSNPSTADPDPQITLDQNGLVGIGTNIPAAKLDVIGDTKLQGNLNVTSVSTFTGNIDANGNLDVDGQTNLDNVSVVGIVTVTNTASGIGLKLIDASNKQFMAGGGGGGTPFAGSFTGHDFRIQVGGIQNAIFKYAAGATGNLELGPSSGIGITFNGATGNANYAGIITATSVVISEDLGINGAAPQTPIDVIANSSGYAINVRGRSSDNVGEIRFTSNNYGSLYGQIIGGPTYLKISTGGQERVELDVNETTFNDVGADTDFRIRTPAQTHMFYVNAGNDQVSIKTSNAQSGAVLTVNGRTHIDTQLTLGSNSTLDAGAQATIYKPATNTLAFATAGANERVNISSTGLTTLKNFSGTGLKLEGAGSAYSGMQIQTTDSSTSVTRNIFIDTVNETGAAVANQVGSVQADGGSMWSWSTQPPGDRTDRRQERLRITANGVLAYNYDAAVSTVAGVDIRTNSGVHIRGSDANTNNTNIYISGAASNQRKCAIIFDPVGGYCRGDLHFCMDNTGDLSDVTVSDTKMVMKADGSMGINTTAPVEKLGISGNIRLVNPTGSVSRIQALPSGTYSLNTSGGSAIAFHRFSDGSGGSDEIAFETHHQGVAHVERVRINKQGVLLVGTQTAQATSPSIQIGSHTFSGNHYTYSTDRVGFQMNGSLKSMALCSTYNDPNHPEYGLVFVHGPDTSNYNVWSISPDGPAKGNDLNLHYGAQASNIHTNNYKKFAFTGAGQFLAPYTPSFCAKGVTSHTGTTSPIDYTQELFDIGDNYNATAGTSAFTAPVTGKYFFHATVMLSANFTDFTYLFLDFVYDGSTQGRERMMPRPSGGGYASIENSGIFHMVAGKTMQVKLSQSGGTSVTVRNDYRFFEGYLIG